MQNARSWDKGAAFMKQRVKFLPSGSRTRTLHAWGPTHSDSGCKLANASSWTCAGSCRQKIVFKKDASISQIEHWHLLLCHPLVTGLTTPQVCTISENHIYLSVVDSYNDARSKYCESYNWRKLSANADAIDCWDIHKMLLLSDPKGCSHSDNYVSNLWLSLTIRAVRGPAWSNSFVSGAIASSQTIVHYLQVLQFDLWVQWHAWSATIMFDFKTFCWGSTREETVEFILRLLWTITVASGIFCKI